MFSAELILAAVTLTAGLCDVISDDACKESPWLCNDLIQLQRIVMTQAIQERLTLETVQEKMEKMEQRMRMMEVNMKEQRWELEEQRRVLGKRLVLEDKMEEERRVMQAQISVLQAKVSSQDILIDHLQHTRTPPMTEDTLSAQGAQIPDRKAPSLSSNARRHQLSSVLENSVTSQARDLQPRSDDRGDIQAVIDQINQHITTMDADIRVLKNTDQALAMVNQQVDLKARQAGTSTFVRWGNTHCPTDAELVYAGYVGGTFLSLQGGGANHLCLTMNPVAGSHHFVSPFVAELYGSEYETQGTDAHDEKDAVCAVCRSNHPTTVMIPGTNVCTQGWSQQYSGFLMADANSNVAASEFICVDSTFEERPGSDLNLESAGLFFTVTRCGSLPCGPYVNNTVVTCAVCSK